MSNEHVAVSVSLSESDVYVATKEMPEQVRVRGFLLIAAALGAGVTTLTNPALSFWKAVLAAGLPTALILLVAIHAERRAARKLIAHLGEAGRNIRYSFGVHGFEMQSAHGRAELEYAGLHHYAITKHALLLYTAPRVAQIIPRRAFMPDQLQQVEQWLSTSIKPAAKTYKSLLWLVGLWLGLVVAFLMVWFLLSS
jgi:hypothetical protein